jgi:Cu-Zn family superoxide dismutase
MEFKKSHTFLMMMLFMLNGCSNQETMEVIDLKTGNIIGELEFSKHQKHIVITPNIHSLPPGLHGFHLHQNRDCGETMTHAKATPGGAAGAHFVSTPEETKHEGPWSKVGHSGDLTNLYVNAEGMAQNTIITNRLTLEDFRNGAVIIHANQDNYTDRPKLGGSGARIACGHIDL